MPHRHFRVVDTVTFNILVSQRQVSPVTIVPFPLHARFRHVSPMVPSLILATHACLQILHSCNASVTQDCCGTFDCKGPGRSSQHMKNELWKRGPENRLLSSPRLKGRSTAAQKH